MPQYPGRKAEIIDSENSLKLQHLMSIASSNSIYILGLQRGTYTINTGTWTIDYTWGSSLVLANLPFNIINQTTGQIYSTTDATITSTEIQLVSSENTGMTPPATGDILLIPIIDSITNIGAGEINKFPAADAGLLARASIVFASGDTLTTEKLSAAIPLIGLGVAPGNEMRLQVSKPTEDTALDMTIKIYEESKVNGTNAVYCTVIESLVVEKIAGAATHRVFDISGLGYGTGNIKIGVSFGVDSGAITPVFALHRK